MDEAKIKRRLIRHKMLFELYLLTLVLVFLSLLWHNEEPILTLWMERLVLFFGTIAFIYSFRLPRVLMEAQQDRIDVEINRRRKRDGIDKTTRVKG